MEIKVGKTTAKAVHLTFTDPVIISTVAAYREALLKLEVGSKDLQLDLSGVSRFDTAGFQLVIALGKELEKNGRRLSVTASSPEVDGLFSLYGEQIPAKE